MQMFLLKISDICQIIAHNSPPLTRQQLRMLLVHRSKRKFLGRKEGKKACSVGALYSLPSEEFFVWISSGDHMFPSAFLQLVLIHSMLIFLLTCSCGSTRATRKIKHPNRMGLACKHNEQVAHSLSFFSPWEDKEALETCKNKVQLIYYTPARGTQTLTNSLLLRGLCTLAREWAEHSDLGQTLEKTKPLYLPEDSQSMTRLAD